MLYNARITHTTSNTTHDTQHHTVLLSLHLRADRYLAVDAVVPFRAAVRGRHGGGGGCGGGGGDRCEAELGGGGGGGGGSA